MPTVRFAVLHAAVRVLPLPESAMAEHPPMEAKPSRKLTVPVGEVPVTLAVSFNYFLNLANGALAVAEVTVMLTPYGPSL